MLAGANLGFVLQMAADDAALEDLDAVKRVQAAGLPVSRVRARADARVAILGNLDDVVRVPDPILRIVDAPRVVMDADPDVELLHKRLDDVQPFHVLRGDSVKAKAFGEGEDLAPFFGRGIGGDAFVVADHAVVHRLDAVLLELGLHLRDDLVGSVVVPDGFRIFLCEALAWVELDDLAAGFGRFLDRLHDGVAVERVGLAADGEAVMFEFI